MLNPSKLIILIFVTILSAGGCAITTSYGKDPVPVEGEKDAYRYTIYYNMYTSKTDIKNRAQGIAQKLVAENGCKGYRLKEIPNTTFGAQDIDYIAYLDC